MPKRRNFYIVTGATSGIGIAAVHALLQKPATVLGIGRTDERCKAALQKLKSAGNRGNIFFESADFANLDDVRSLALRITDKFPVIDALINNAGTFTMRRELTVSGEELQFAVNHLAPFLLTNLLMPALAKSISPRVINVSSGSHFSGKMHWNDLSMQQFYNGLHAYEQSKLANVLFSYELSRRFRESHGLRSYAVDPGLVRTDMGFKGKGVLSKIVWAYRKLHADPPEKGAQTLFYLATTPEAREDMTYWKGLVPAPSSDESYSAETAARLWKISEQKVNIKALLLEA